MAMWFAAHVVCSVAYLEFGLWGGSGSVSYTHLDVYKRQVIYWLFIFSFLSLFMIMSIISSTGMSVHIFMYHTMWKMCFHLHLFFILFCVVIHCVFLCYYYYLSDEHFLVCVLWLLLFCLYSKKRLCVCVCVCCLLYTSRCV